MLNGDNHLEIRYTTVLFNYCRSLTDNPVVTRWTGLKNLTGSSSGDKLSSGNGLIPNGPEGFVRIKVMRNVALNTS